MSEHFLKPLTKLDMHRLSLADLFFDLGRREDCKREMAKVSDDGMVNVLFSKACWVVGLEDQNWPVAAFAAARIFKATNSPDSCVSFARAIYKARKGRGYEIAIRFLRWCSRRYPHLSRAVHYSRAIVFCQSGEVSRASDEVAIIGAMIMQSQDHDQATLDLCGFMLAVQRDHDLSPIHAQTKTAFESLPVAVRARAQFNDTLSSKYLKN